MPNRISQKDIVLKYVVIYIISALHLHQNNIMGQVNSTFSRSTKGMTEAYADFNGLSFSSAISILTTNSAIEWWNTLSVEQRNSYNKKFKIFPSQTFKKETK